MSDLPKGLQRAADFRWILLSVALLLTVIAGTLGWVEMKEGIPAAPRAFSWGFAIILWIGFITLCCTVIILKRMARQQQCAKRQVDELAESTKRQLEELAGQFQKNMAELASAVAEGRLAELASMIQNDNVRPMQGRR